MTTSKIWVLVRCVYDRKHTKLLTVTEAARGMPFCDHDGGPMVAVGAEGTANVRNARRRSR